MPPNAECDDILEEVEEEGDSEMEEECPQQEQQELVTDRPTPIKYSPELLPPLYDCNYSSQPEPVVGGKFDALAKANSFRKKFDFLS